MIDALSRVGRIQDICLERGVDCFLVSENNDIIGVLTVMGLMNTHPNRIVADAMSKNFLCVNSDVAIWKVKDIFDNNNIEILIIRDDNLIRGIVTKQVLNVEIGRHVDLLTDLYKKDYIIYNAAKLINKRDEMSIIFIDINDFGHIDKQYGHINGDLVLKNFAILLKNNISTETYLCRYGGDEFVIAAPYYIDKSRVFTEELLNNIRLNKFPNNISISASAGIAGLKKSINRVYDTFSVVSNLINIASLASSEAKRNKKGSVVVSCLDIDEIA